MKGFTLIELLVVVLMIGILAAVALPQYQVAVLKSQFMQVISVGEAVAKAEEVYLMANGNYTSDFSLLDVEIPAKNITLSLDVRAAALHVMQEDLGLHYLIILQNLGFGYASPGARFCRVDKNHDSPNLHKMCGSLTGKKPLTSAGTRYAEYQF